MPIAFKPWLLVVAAGVAAVTLPAQAASPASPLDKVIACSSIADAAARLACFDGSVAELRSSQASGDLVAVNREQMDQTRKSLFGLTLPQFSLFNRHAGAKGKDAGDDSEIKELVGSVRQVSKSADGSWIVVLDDGARWQQTDSTSLGRFPKSGSKVLIRKAALNSYKMQIDRGVFMQVRRVN